jgi:beta-galactosidase
MRLPREFDRVTWYGRGPHENYQDRKTAAFVGKYHARVAEMGETYISPQENGYRTEVRWARLSSPEGEGVRIQGEPLFSFSALFYTTGDLTRERRGELHTVDLVERDFIELNIDREQMGVGGDNSWGALPLEKYRIFPKAQSFRFILVPEESRPR